MSTKRPRSPSPSPGLTTPTDVFISEAITDRSSIFIGHFSPTLRAKALQSLPDIASASHKIAAWRFLSPQRTLPTTSSAKNNGTSQRKILYETGHSDDGETNGGRTLEKLLDSMQVTGSVVVARWYGGVMLGPVRFTHMETCARNAIRAWREEEAAKKRRVEEEEKEEEMLRRLPEVLEDRDRSVEVLRGLLSGKVRRRQEREGGLVEAKAATTTPVKKVDYKGMPKERLKMLEAARDRTIAFLLKQIDAEEEKERKWKEEEAKRTWLAEGTEDGIEEKSLSHSDSNNSELKEAITLSTQDPG